MEKIMEVIFLSKKLKIQGTVATNQGDASISPFQIKL
jgi:hypothetical protein